MSTKVTLSHNDDYHLYEECFEQENVWLQLDNPTELSVYAHHEEKSAGSSVTVAIPIATWRHIVEGWLNSHWAQHPDRDNEPVLSSVEDTIAWLEGITGAENE